MQQGVSIFFQAYRFPTPAGQPLRENKFTSLVFQSGSFVVFCSSLARPLAGRPPLTCVQQQRTGCAQRQWNEKGSYEYNKIILW
jgi:hypothetical protein